MRDALERVVIHEDVYINTSEEPFDSKSNSILDKRRSYRDGYHCEIYTNNALSDIICMKNNILLPVTYTTEIKDPVPGIYFVEYFIINRPSNTLMEEFINFYDKNNDKNKLYKEVKEYIRKSLETYKDITVFNLKIITFVPMNIVTNKKQIYVKDLDVTIGLDLRTINDEPWLYRVSDVSTNDSVVIEISYQNPNSDKDLMVNIFNEEIMIPNMSSKHQKTKSLILKYIWLDNRVRQTITEIKNEDIDALSSKGKSFKLSAIGFRLNELRQWRKLLEEDEKTLLSLSKLIIDNKVLLDSYISNRLKVYQEGFKMLKSILPFK